jgi:hypothetical protein
VLLLLVAHLILRLFYCTIRNSGALNGSGLDNRTVDVKGD